MNLLIIGLGVGLLRGLLLGMAYNHWMVSKIVELAILSYRVEEEKDRAERLQKFIDEMEEDE